MRVSVDTLRRMVKRDLATQFVPQPLASSGSLERLRRYVQRIDLPARLRAACAGLGGDDSGGRLARLLMALFLRWRKPAGAPAVSRGRSLVARFGGLRRLPSARSVSDWLKRFTQATLRPLVQLNVDVVLDAIGRSELPRLTLDVDGTVVRTGATVA